MSNQFEITSEDVPSLYRSALISAGGVIFALGLFYIFRAVFPEWDSSVVGNMMLTAVGAWLVNLIKVFVEGK